MFSLGEGRACLVPGPFRGAGGGSVHFWYHVPSGGMSGRMSMSRGLGRVCLGWVCLVVGTLVGGMSRGWDLAGGGYSPLRGTTPKLTSSGGHRSGRYASYWNAFLFC